MRIELSQQQGAIYQVPLEKDFGFAYVKQILTKEFSEEPYVLFKVFNKHTTEEIQLNPFEFSNLTELSYRLLSLNLAPIRGKNKWKYIGDSALTEDESILPEFKADFSSKFWDTKNWNNIQWSIVRNLDPTDRREYFSLEQVQKLGLWQHNSIFAITTKLTMFWIKRLGKSIESFYSEKELYEDFRITPSYFETENLIFLD